MAKNDPPEARAIWDKINAKYVQQLKHYAEAERIEKEIGQLTQKVLKMRAKKKSPSRFAK